jgi:hypothetical protein
LEKHPAPLVVEPSSVVAPPIPTSWLKGVARLDYQSPFTGIPQHRWRLFLDDCNRFLTSDEKWAEQAARLGWNAAVLLAAAEVSP